MPSISTSLEQEFRPRKPKSRCVLIGRDREGHWVAIDKEGICGGLFTSRDAAFSYALTENGNSKAAIEIVQGPLELSADEFVANAQWR